MNKDQKTQLHRLVAEKLGSTIKDASAPEAALSDLGMDSWDKREELMDAIDDAFGIKIGEARYAPETIEALEGVVALRLDEQKGE